MDLYLKAIADILERQNRAIRAIVDDNPPLEIKLPPKLFKPITRSEE